jgi:disease resistance protein RPM1
MTETALSMARSMLGSAVSKAAAAASDEMSLLMGVQKEIWYVRPSVFVAVTLDLLLVVPSNS